MNVKFTMWPKNRPADWVLEAAADSERRRIAIVGLTKRRRMLFWCGVVITTGVLVAYFLVAHNWFFLSFGLFAIYYYSLVFSRVATDLHILYQAEEWPEKYKRPNQVE